MGKKTHEQFVDEVKDLFGNDYTILGIYKNTSTKILIKHNKCFYEWDVYPGNLLSGQSKCPKCSGKIRMTTESYKERIKELTNGEYEVLGEYVQFHTKVKMMHVICGYSWESKPRDFISCNNRCPRCQKRERYTEEDFKKRVEEVSHGEIVPMDKYKNNYTKINFKHLICGATFKESPTRIINELKDCPECNSPFSKGEKRIVNFLQEKGIYFETQCTFEDCKNVKLLRFDFAINYNNRISLIEFDGKQHFEPVEWFGGEDSFTGIQRRDQIKNEYCKNKDIPLLRIPYWKFNNIPSVIEDFLMQLD
jgi:uncharacterized CHY-type Zn-finger protein